MTEGQRLLLIGGLTAVTAIIFAARWFVRKKYYEYNEFTGRMEPKRKVRSDNTSKDKQKDVTQKSEDEMPSFIPNSVDKRSVKYVPKDEYHEEWLFVKAVEKAQEDNRFLIKFVNYFDENEFITLYVDEETFTDARIGDSGNLCYNYKYSIFHYFDKGPKIFKDEQ